MPEYCENCRLLQDENRGLRKDILLFNDQCVGIRQTLEARVEFLTARLEDYRIQSKAAMKAQSLGLCKAVIKHAIEDDKLERSLK